MTAWQSRPPGVSKILRSYTPYELWGLPHLLECRIKSQLCPRFLEALSHSAGHVPFLKGVVKAPPAALHCFAKRCLYNYEHGTAPSDEFITKGVLRAIRVELSNARRP